MCKWNYFKTGQPTSAPEPCGLPLWGEALTRLFLPGTRIVVLSFSCRICHWFFFFMLRHTVPSSQCTNLQRPPQLLFLDCRIFWKWKLNTLAYCEEGKQTLLVLLFILAVFSRTFLSIQSLEISDNLWLQHKAYIMPEQNLDCFIYFCFALDSLVVFHIKAKTCREPQNCRDGCFRACVLFCPFSLNTIDCWL